MKTPTWRQVTTEAKLLLIGIPVLIWTMLPIYHLFLFSISPKESAFAGKLWPDHPTLHNFEVVFREQHNSGGEPWLVATPATPSSIAADLKALFNEF